MAQYKAMEGFDKMDQKELTGYLYQLNEQLRYMFDNLTPEDNYSNQALTKYLEDEKRVASLKFDLDGLKVEVSDFEKNTNAKFEVTDSKIDMKVSKGTVSSEISLESGQVTISGNRLVVNSTNFKLDASGNATFSGTVKGATITGSHIRCKGGAFEADEDAVYIGGFYTFDTSRGQYLGTGDQSTGMGDNDLYCFWTGWDGTGNINDTKPQRILDHYGCVLSPSNAYAQELYLNHPVFSGKTHYWGVGETIQDIYDRLDSLKSSS